MAFLIEKLALEQIPQFFAVFSLVMRDGFDYTPKVKEHFLTKAYSLVNFEYWLKNNYKSILVAKENNNIIGFLVYDAPYGGVIMVRWLGVLPQYRKNGLGRQLLDELVKVAQELGCHKVELCGQPDAKGFYEKYGLVQEGYRPKSYFGQDQYLFGKVVGEVKEEAIVKRI